MKMSEFGTGKTIFVLAIVVGCFAVLWPKVFYPMLTASLKNVPEGRQAATEGVTPRPERPSHLHPAMMHPALRDKGRALPQRTIEKQARPGPMPGVRPPMGGGAGHIAPPHNTKGASSMSVIMPLYTVGIIIFFIYTIMKVLFKKTPDDDEKTPKLKDFHLDPEYRKYVFAEEYLDSGSGGEPYPPTRRDCRKMEQREGSGLNQTRGVKKRVPSEHTEPKIEDEQMDQLRRRLEDTEKAMEKLMSQMGSVSDKLTAAKITEVLSQAQAQAKLLKNDASISSSKGSSPDMDDFEIVQKAGQNQTKVPSKIVKVTSKQHALPENKEISQKTEEENESSEKIEITDSEPLELSTTVEEEKTDLQSEANVNNNCSEDQNISTGCRVEDIEE